MGRLLVVGLTVASLLLGLAGCLDESASIAALPRNCGPWAQAGPMLAGPPLQITDDWFTDEVVTWHADRNETFGPALSAVRDAIRAERRAAFEAVLHAVTVAPGRVDAAGSGNATYWARIEVPSERTATGEQFTLGLYGTAEAGSPAVVLVRHLVAGAPLLEARAVVRSSAAFAYLAEHAPHPVEWFWVRPGMVALRYQAGPIDGVDEAELPSALVVADLDLGELRCAEPGPFWPR